ncbi:hypothetical protein CcrRB23_gp483 [Caulobacter phage RB23]|nr:hypothetical protein CcrRB23_gp483 [Caulobacter phage RB23]
MVSSHERLDHRCLHRLAGLCQRP